MQTVDIDSLITKTDSIHKLVVLTARRAVELAEGAARLVPAGIQEKTINIALREIDQGKISFKVPKEKK